MKKLFIPFTLILSISLMSFVADNQSPLLRTKEGVIIAQANSVLSSEDKTSLIELLEKNNNLGAMVHSTKGSVNYINVSAEDLKLLESKYHLNMNPEEGDVAMAGIIKKFVSWRDTKNVKTEQTVMEEVDIRGQVGYDDMTKIFEKYETLDLKY
ncbi:MAG: hypothetical protein MUF43_12375 [Flavobacterium sp.]|jgi:hypothetical protein|nr:hypothetical protein [Flavobacterium sp.]